MRYEQPSPMTRVQLEDALRSTDGSRVRDALLSASYSEDGRWVQDYCIKLAGHPESIVRHAVALVLGHIAIAHRGDVDLLKCLEAVRNLTADSDTATRVAALDGLNDVLHAIGLQATAQS